MSSRGTGVDRLAELDRLFYVYASGERVRAARTIVYVTSGVEIPEGARGTVDMPRGYSGVRGVAVVQWDAGPRETTTCDSLEPVESPKR